MWLPLTSRTFFEVLFRLHMVSIRTFSPKNPLGLGVISIQILNEKVGRYGRLQDVAARMLREAWFFRQL